MLKALEEHPVFPNTLLDIVSTLLRSCCLHLPVVSPQMHSSRQISGTASQWPFDSSPTCPWRPSGRHAVASQGPACSSVVTRASPSNDESPDNMSSGGNTRSSSSSSSSNPWGTGWAKSGKPSAQKGRASRTGAPLRRPSDRQQQRIPTPTTSDQDDKEVDPELEAAIRANVDRAAALLDEIIKDINRRMFMTEATAYLYDEEPEMKLSQVSLCPVWTTASSSSNSSRGSSSGSSNSSGSSRNSSMYSETEARPFTNQGEYSQAAGVRPRRWKQQVSDSSNRSSSGTSGSTKQQDW